MATTTCKFGALTEAYRADLLEDYEVDTDVRRHGLLLFVPDSGV